MNFFKKIKKGWKNRITKWDESFWVQIDYFFRIWPPINSDNVFIYDQN